MTFVVGCSRFVVWSRKPEGQRLNDVVIVGLCASPNRAAQAWGPAVPSGAHIRTKLAYQNVDMCSLLKHGAISGRRCVCWGSLLSLGPALVGWSPVVAHEKTSENVPADGGAHGYGTGYW